MTAKEKALELVDEFRYVTIMDMEVEAMSISLAKRCALICVDEILKASVTGTRVEDYWKEVKQEINKL